MGTAQELATILHSLIEWATAVETSPPNESRKIAGQHKEVIKAIDALNRECVTLYHIAASDILQICKK